MSSWSAVKFTQLGLQTYAQLLAAGEQIVFSKFALGSGELDDSVEAESLTELVHWEKDLGISRINNNNNNNNSEVVLSTTLTNLSIFTGFYLREIGIYIKYNGYDVLFAYLSDFNPSFLPAEGVRTVSYPIDITIILSGTDNITATIDLTNVALQSDVISAKKELREEALTLRDVYNAVFYIGFVLTLDSNVDPNNIYTGTTWEKFAEGRVLVSASSSDADFTLGKTGGEKTHTLSTAETPYHAHTIYGAGNHNHWSLAALPRAAQWDACDGNDNPQAIGYGDGCWEGHKVDGHTSTDGNHTHNMSGVGGNQAHNNLQPYRAVNMWRRTA